MTRHLAAPAILTSLFLALSAPSAAAQSDGGCFWGVMAPNRVYLCPETSADGDQFWRVTRSERLAPPQRAPARHQPHSQAPRHADDRGQRPHRSRWPAPRVFPRVGVGVNSSGDVNVGAGVGVGLGIFSLGVDLID